METNEELVNKLRRLKLRLGIDLRDTEKDDALTILLEEAGTYILMFTRRDERRWLKQFDTVQLQVAAINYGRLGMEGVQSHSEGGVSTSFFGKEDYPESVTKALVPYRHLGR